VPLETLGGRPKDKPDAVNTDARKLAGLDLLTHPKPRHASDIGSVAATDVFGWVDLHRRKYCRAAVGRQSGRPGVGRRFPDPRQDLPRGRLAGLGYPRVKVSLRHTFAAVLQGLASVAAGRLKV